MPAEVMATVRQMVKSSRAMCTRAMRAEGIKVHAPSFAKIVCMSNCGVLNVISRNSCLDAGGVMLAVATFVLVLTELLLRATACHEKDG